MLKFETDHWPTFLVMAGVGILLWLGMVAGVAWIVSSIIKHVFF